MTLHRREGVCRAICRRVVRERTPDLSEASTIARDTASSTSPGRARPRATLLNLRAEREPLFRSGTSGKVTRYSCLCTIVGTRPPSPAPRRPQKTRPRVPPRTIPDAPAGGSRRRALPEMNRHESGADGADEHSRVEPREERALVGEERLGLDAHGDGAGRAVRAGGLVASQESSRV